MDIIVQDDWVKERPFEEGQYYCLRKVSDHTQPLVFLRELVLRTGCDQAHRW